MTLLLYGGVILATNRTLHEPHEFLAILNEILSCRNAVFSCMNDSDGTYSSRKWEKGNLRNNSGMKFSLEILAALCRFFAVRSDPRIMTFSIVMWCTALHYLVSQKCFSNRHRSHTNLIIQVKDKVLADYRRPHAEAYLDSLG
jgi:hypothetical protein